MECIGWNVRVPWALRVGFSFSKQSNQIAPAADKNANKM